MGKLAAWVALTVALVACLLNQHGGQWVGDELGYLEASRDLTGPSRFPLGLPLLLAPLSVGAARVLIMGIALGLTGAVWWAAVKVGGWRSGVAAGVLMVLSDGFTHAGEAIMADPLAALLIVGALLAVLHERPVLAGVLTALSGWVRIVHVAFVAALPRRSWLPAGAVVVALVAWQLLVKGSLLGYGTGEASFALGNITGPVSLEHSGTPAEVTNLVYFPAVLGAGFGGTFAPGLLILGVLGLRRHWGPGARFAAGIVALNVAMYLPYFFQSARFMLPAGCLLTVYGAGWLGGRREVLDPVAAVLADPVLRR